MVVEADESDRSFLRLAPEVAVVTNVELDHHATYGSEPEVGAAFASFLERLPAGRHRRGVGGSTGSCLPPGAAGWCGSASAPMPTLARAGCRADAARHRVSSWSATGEPVATVELPAPGEHNVLNALAALGACRGWRAAT